MALDAAGEQLLAFWFSEEARPKWWEKDEAFDEGLRARFGALREEAASGALDAWAQTARGALALILLLDQLPRNLFRGDPRSYATDAKARAVTRAAIEAGLDRALNEEERLFLYLPLEHSEDLADQQDCCRLIAELTSQPEWLKFAEIHRDIVQRFGRFPHRNEVLGRKSTAEEEAFLQEPHSSF